jgi:hypothetical protein
MIYEDFNRPKAFRIIENLKQRVTNKPHTLGVMQVRSKKLLTDKESVILGTAKILEAHKKFIKEHANDEEGFYDWSIYSEIISEYNGGASYNREVLELVDILINEFYKNTNDTIQPPTKEPATEIEQNGS